MNGKNTIRGKRHADVPVEDGGGEIGATVNTQNERKDGGEDRGQAQHAPPLAAQDFAAQQRREIGDRAPSMPRSIARSATDAKRHPVFAG